MQTAKISFFVISIMLFVSAAASNNPGKKIGKREYHTNRLGCDAPRIDGILNDPSWDEGEWTGNFVQRIPRGGDAPSLKTVFKILYDEKNIYIAFRCYDPEPGKIMRLTGKRDELKGDAVGIAFDSYFDQRTAFEFDVTAGGGKVDMIGTEDGQSWNFNWNAVWLAKTAVNDSGWTAEILIPFSQLRFSDNNVQTWGMHVTRRIYRYNEEDNWQLIPIDAPGMIHLFGELHGIEGISKSSRMEIMPYTVGKMKFNKPEAGNPYATGFSKNATAGFDAKVGLTSNFTLDLTVNPDFGQVEADPSVLNLTVYETIFEEKRPFFIEGSNMLQFGTGASSLFYSRRIGAPPPYNPSLQSGQYMNRPSETSILSAAKITGKTQNGFSLGILQCLTTNEYAKISNGDSAETKTKVQPLTSYTVAQLQQDYKQGNTVIGGAFTSTNRIFEEQQFNFLNKNAYTGGFSVLQQFYDKTYYIKFSGAASYINGDSLAMIRAQRSSVRYFQRPDNFNRSLDSGITSMTGTGGALMLGKKGNGRFIYYEEFKWASPKYEANDLGYLAKSDFIAQKTAISYKVNDPSKFYTRYSIFSEQVFQWDFSGNNTLNWVEVAGSMTLKNYYGGSGGVFYQYHINDPRILRGGPMMKLPSSLNTYFNINTDDRKKVTLIFHYNNYKYDDGISRTTNYNLNLNWKVNNSIILGSAFSYAPDVIDYQYVAKTGNQYILANLSRQTAFLTLRIGVYITPEISIQYYGNPYLSVGKYTNFKKVTDPQAGKYADRFYNYSSSEISKNTIDNRYYVNEQSSGASYNFANPDFRFREFHSNLVFKWEFRPSSNLYLVWTHGRTENQSVSDYSLARTASGLFSIYPENVFLIKFSYWFSI